MRAIVVWSVWLLVAWAVGVLVGRATVAPAASCAPTPATAGTVGSAFVARVLQTDAAGPLPTGEPWAGARDPTAPPLGPDLPLAADERIVLVTAACGRHGTDELATWLKAVLLFGAGAGGLPAALALFDIHIMADAPARAAAEPVLDAWAPLLPAPLPLTWHNATLPPGVPDLFRPCATQRLRLPSLLPDHVPLALYLDRDVLVLQDLRPLWRQRLRFSPHHLVALSLEVPDPDRSYYRMPMHGSSGGRPPAINPWGLGGLNSGVMLADLARLRAAGAEAAWQAVVRTHGAGALHLGDQDVLNVWLHAHPDAVLPLPCDWNARGDCLPTTLRIVHCNRSVQKLRPHSFPGRLWQTVLLWPGLPLPTPLRDRILERVHNSTGWAPRAAHAYSGWDIPPNPGHKDRGHSRPTPAVENSLVD
jgi:hypothetical protein